MIGAHSETDLHNLGKLGNRPPDTEPARPPVLIRFVDCNGRRWVRWPDGKLDALWPSIAARRRRHRSSYTAQPRAAVAPGATARDRPSGPQRLILGRRA
jgi:hypothetical protein